MRMYLILSLSPECVQQQRYEVYVVVYDLLFGCKASAALEVYFIGLSAVHGLTTT